MALVSVSGVGLYYPRIWPGFSTPAFSSTAVGPIDAAGEMAAYVGRVWFPDRTGTKSIRYICFRFGTVVKTNGSTIIASLQNVSTTATPPGVPDEVIDEHVHIANADAGYASNTWYKTAALSADRAVTYGSDLAVVVEYDSFSAGDSFYLSSMVLGSALDNPHTCFAVNKVGAPAWAVIAAIPNVIFEFTDGTFGTLDGSYSGSAYNAHQANLGTTVADEFALNFQVPFPCVVDGLWSVVSPSAATADFELLLYSGTSAIATVTVDANTTVSSNPRKLLAPIPETTLAENTLYRVAVRPTVTGSGGNVSCYSLDVADANHFTVHAGGTSLQYSTRLDQGAWSAATTTRRLLAGVRISQLYATPTFPDASKVYYGTDRGDGTTGTLHASNISTAAGSGENLSGGILASGHTVDDVAGSLSGGGGGASVIGSSVIVPLEA